MFKNLEPDDGFSPHSMPEIFYKTGRDLADILTAWAEFKPVLQPRFSVITVYISTVY